MAAALEALRRLAPEQGPLLPSEIVAASGVKQSSLPQLLRRLRERGLVVQVGGAWRPTDPASAQADAEHQAGLLNPGQRETLGLLALSESARPGEMAAAMGLAELTVRNHLTVLRSCGCASSDRRTWGVTPFGLAVLEHCEPTGAPPGPAEPAPPARAAAPVLRDVRREITDALDARLHGSRLEMRLRGVVALIDVHLGIA